ncbi:unnamed protein product, partial [Amoebophrya sp. A25]
KTDQDALRRRVLLNTPDEEPYEARRFVQEYTLDLHDIDLDVVNEDDHDEYINVFYNKNLMNHTSPSTSG